MDFSQLRNYWESILAHIAKQLSWEKGESNSAEINQPSSIRAEKAAMELFLHNFYWGEELSDQNAKSNIESGVVEIIYSTGEHASNGILITKNGLLVTSYHCVNKDITGVDLVSLKIRCADNQEYPLQKICGYNQASDIAIVKADIPGESLPFVYRFSNRHDFAEMFPIVLLCRKNGKLLVKGGYVNRPSIRTLQDSLGTRLTEQVTMSFNGVQGDSGGVVLDAKGYKIYGVLCAGLVDIKGIRVSTCTFWFKVLELISDIVYGNSSRKNASNK